MKMPIEWHRECLKNISNHYNIENSALSRQQNKVNKLAWDIMRLRKQIDAASARGKDGFDNERFMKMDNPYL